MFIFNLLKCPKCTDLLLDICNFTLSVYLSTHLPNRLISSLNLHKARGQTDNKTAMQYQMKRQTAAQTEPLVCTKEEV